MFETQKKKKENERLKGPRVLIESGFYNIYLSIKCSVVYNYKYTLSRPFYFVVVHQTKKNDGQDDGSSYFLSRLYYSNCYLIE